MNVSKCFTCIWFKNLLSYRCHQAKSISLVGMPWYDCRGVFLRFAFPGLKLKVYTQWPLLRALCLDVRCKYYLTWIKFTNLIRPQRATWWFASKYFGLAKTFTALGIDEEGCVLWLPTVLFSIPSWHNFQRIWLSLSDLRLKSASTANFTQAKP